MFGGGYASIPLLRYEVVIRRQWITEQEFIDIIAIAESTPGPIAINSATYIGYKVAGIVGAFLATFAVVLPAFVTMLSVSTILIRYYDHYIARGILNGIRGAILGLLISSLVILIRSIIKDGSFATSILTFIISMFTLICILILEIDPAITIVVSICLGLILALLKIW